VLKRLYNAASQPMGWHPHIPVAHSIEAAAPYLTPEHQGEAVLTIGGPLLLHQRGEISGLVCVAPLECLPNKIAESQLFPASEDMGVLTVAVYVNGDLLDAEVLDNFVYEVKKKYAAQRARGHVFGSGAPGHSLTSLSTKHGVISPA
jgi:predicted nucleotide-binding protein (sugar kinase/HSP70/actin superfamily)